ncbi:hypothetical protein [Actinokineospora globicatena]|uniref:hypothetical protein n=1 Tax=Actinokineospora globicatena TaxID=103729 RepID=UPI0020A362ED|nr:hypothetical protein [Actinokineospora globicatena]MCP2303468.1 hypothetical protein [Actinokineospora globicatena]GLW79398.1 hypothetical protein Aglo01_38800 [Actinokineospora globicatena]GLW86192.1 hypothetical protein Aglo02_38310 [Actinokineospora globicatena]
MGWLILFLPTAAVWVVLVGALINHSGPIVTVPLGVGALLGAVAVLTQEPWFLVPVVLAWAWGVAMLVRAERRTR